MSIEQQVADWKHLKALTKKISTAEHPEVRRQYTQDLYNGVKDYWLKYHTKFDFSREPTEVDK